MKLRCENNMINYSIILDGGKIPERAHPSDAGLDLVAASDPKIVGEILEQRPFVTIYKSIDYIEYDTGVKLIDPHMEIWDNKAGSRAPIERKKIYSQIFPRSSISKYNLTLANSVGVIDNGFQSNILLRFKYVVQPCDLVIIKKNVEFDSSYRNNDISNIGVIINEDKIYKRGDKLGQLIPVIQLDNIKFNIIEKVEQISDRAGGGFGSSDQK